MKLRIRRLAWIMTLCGAGSLCGMAQSTSAPSTPAPEQTSNPAPKKAKHVYTNDDIASSPDAGKTTDHKSEPAAVPPPKEPKVSADQVRATIRKQKARVAAAEANRDRIVQLAGRRAPRADQLKQAQARIDKEKSTLSSMQETYRKMGYGSSVYDAN